MDSTPLATLAALWLITAPVVPALAASPAGDKPYQPVLFWGQRFDDEFVSVAGGWVEGSIVIQDGILTSRKNHAVPLEIEYRVQTDSTNIRIGYAAQQIIFNWEVRPDELRIDGGPASGRHVPGMGKVPPGRAVTIRQVVKEDRMELYVDDEPRAEWVADFRGIDAPIRLFSGQTLTVDSIRIRPLPPTAPAPQVQALPDWNEKFLSHGEQNVGGSDPAGSVDPSFDVTRDWTLDLGIIPGSPENDSQMVFLWGDSRPGMDTLYVRQRLRGIEVGTWAQPGGYLCAMLPTDRPGAWIQVSVSFDASEQRLVLFLDGVKVAESPCGMLYADRPMPIYLGQAHGSQRFTGRLREVSLRSL